MTETAVMECKECGKQLVGDGSLTSPWRCPDQAVHDARLRRVCSVTGSSFTHGRWLCDLICGHQQWVRADEPPREVECQRCPRDDRQATRAAQIIEGSGQGETAETAAFKDRWKVEVHCRACQASFELERRGMHVSLRQTAPFTRQVLLAVPEACPTCKSLAVVPAQKDKP